MRPPRSLFVATMCALLLGGMMVVMSASNSTADHFFPRTPPRTFDDLWVASALLPLMSGTVPRQMSSQQYYSMPVRPIFRSYPVYRPGRQPAGYLEWLRRQEPMIDFDADSLHSYEDWVRAGETVFDAPLRYGSILGASDDYIDDERWYAYTGTPVAADGTLPFYRYVIRERGRVELGVGSCAMCHTRVLDDGRIVKGAQGNFPFERAVAWEYRTTALPDEAVRRIERAWFAAPWLGTLAYPQLDSVTSEGAAALHEAIPAGVIARHGTSPLAPVRVPDLIGVARRRFLGATGLVRHNGIGDLMRYAAMNQMTDLLAWYGDFVPADGSLVLSPADRYSDDQLYALAIYLYALTPPPASYREDALTAQGQRVFEREACGACHTPPMYTNNRLTPALGFEPDERLTSYDLLSTSVGTDPILATSTRRATGYYKVPSLKGLWYRGRLEHSGSVSSLEEWFDSRRLRDDFVPAAHERDTRPARAIRGHEFGLRLSPGDRRALIAFLNTL